MRSAPFRTPRSGSAQRVCPDLRIALTFGACLLATAVAPTEARADAYAELREQMVRDEVEAAGVDHPGVLKALRATPRHEFVPAGFRDLAYRDVALPIGDAQTISPPYVVAYMTQALDPQPTDRVLEIGAGSGYQAAVLSGLVREVYTIEIVERLAQRAARTLERLGYDNVHVRAGDGYLGWPEVAPFDKIIVTCSPERVPQALVDQLRDGGRMIIPVGERYRQNLVRLTKRGDQLEREDLQATLFVPMTGTAEDQREVRPDPAQPQLFNGDFEQSLGTSTAPRGWHYLRQAELIVAPDAPQGRQFLRFASPTAGAPARALQGLALDGRQVAAAELHLQIRGQALQAGPGPDQQAAAFVTFYAARRAAIDTVQLGPWSGTFDWRRESRRFRVPLAAREAIVRLGLHGGQGTLDVDDVRLTVQAP
jgi:protein-L-isoaspartate(D-aspartate) O-methyltransferase